MLQCKLTERKLNLSLVLRGAFIHHHNLNLYHKTTIHLMLLHYWFLFKVKRHVYFIHSLICAGFDGECWNTNSKTTYSISLFSINCNHFVNAFIQHFSNSSDKWTFTIISIHNRSHWMLCCMQKYIRWDTNAVLTLKSPQMRRLPCRTTAAWNAKAIQLNNCKQMLLACKQKPMSHTNTSLFR